MNSMILFTIATIFVSNTFGCELTLGKGSALCQAVQNDVNELAKAFGGLDISGECTCDAGKAKAGCDLLQTQKNQGEYKFAPVCEEIKKTLTAPDAVKALLNCNDQNTFKNSYAKVSQCNAENAAASSSNTAMVIEASSSSPMVVAESTPIMIQASSSAAKPEQPAMSTSMAMDMMSSMVEDMDSAAMQPTASMDITPSSSMDQNRQASSSVSTPGAANVIKITHAVLVITALVAMLFSLM